MFSTVSDARPALEGVVRDEARGREARPQDDAGADGVQQVAAAVEVP